MFRPRTKLHYYRGTLNIFPYKISKVYHFRLLDHTAAIALPSNSAARSHLYILRPEILAPEEVPYAFGVELSFSLRLPLASNLEILVGRLTLAPYLKGVLDSHQK